MRFELHLREDDLEIVGTVSIPYCTNVPPLGTWVEIAGVRLSVADAVTKLVVQDDGGHEEVTVECHARFDDNEIEHTLMKLAKAGVEFDSDVLDLLIDVMEVEKEMAEG